MKKFFAKLGIFIIMSTILVMATAPAYADEDGEIQGAAEQSEAIKAFYKQFDDSQCIKEDTKGVVTIIEEPFGDTEEKTSGESGENNYFEIRKCFRNVWFDEEVQSAVMSQLLENCSDKKGEDVFLKPVHTCQEVTVIISGGGTTLISNYVGTIYRWAASLVGIICVLVIVASGIQLAASGGDSSATEGAKKRIVQSLSGLAVLFLSGLILYTVNPNFFTATQ